MNIITPSLQTEYLVRSNMLNYRPKHFGSCKISAYDQLRDGASLTKYLRDPLATLAKFVREWFQKRRLKLVVPSTWIVAFVFCFKPFMNVAVFAQINYPTLAKSEEHLARENLQPSAPLFVFSVSGTVISERSHCCICWHS